VAKKKPRATTVSPLPIPTDAICFTNRVGVNEIVKILYANGPSSKIRKFYVQWYNEYGGSETGRWEQETSPFWSIQVEYGELLKRYKEKHPPPALVILDDGEWRNEQ
jgi:hypothetical protein